jgi:hypothetical protein
VKTTATDFDPQKIGHATNQEINVDFTFEEVIAVSKTSKMINPKELI